MQQSLKPNEAVSFDCSANAEICRSLDILSYPAIRFDNRDGRVERYRGPRKAAPYEPSPSLIAAPLQL